MSGLDMLSGEDKRRVGEVLTTGSKVLQEIEDLNGGLKDTVKAVAAEINIKPALLMKAVKVNFKNKLADEEAAMDTVRTLLEATGNS